MTVPAVDGLMPDVTANRPPARPRSVRVRDDVWGAALAAAAERGEVLSEEIVKFLERYARKRSK